MGFFANFLRRHCDETFTIRTHDGKPYLRRYVITRNKWFRIFIHEILMSDEDEEMHDHPWDFTTFLLSGGYVEEIPRGNYISKKYREKGMNEEMPLSELKTRTYRPRFSIIRHRAEDFHRIELEKPVWTLFFAGNKRRQWGFMTENGWEYYRSFLDRKFGTKSEAADAYIKYMD